MGVCVARERSVARGLRGVGGGRWADPREKGNRPETVRVWCVGEGVGSRNLCIVLPGGSIRLRGLVSSTRLPLIARSTGNI